MELLIKTTAKVENAGGQFYLAFPYISAVGSTTEKLTLKVPIKHDQPTASDRKALMEAAAIQGGLGQWTQKDDGAVWLVATGG